MLYEGSGALIVNKITTAFQRAYSIAGNELHMTTSIGICIFPDDSDNIEILLKYDDHAMYEAKERGRNTYRFYSSAIDVKQRLPVKKGFFLLSGFWKFDSTPELISDNRHESLITSAVIFLDSHYTLIRRSYQSMESIPSCEQRLR